MAWRFTEFQTMSSTASRIETQYELTRGGAAVPLEDVCRGLCKRALWAVLGGEHGCAVV